MARLIDLDDDRHTYCGDNGEYERWSIDPDVPAVEAVPIEWIQKKIQIIEETGDFYSSAVLVEMIEGWRTKNDTVD